MCRQNDRTEESAIQLQVKTILNVVQHFVGFVYNEVRLPCRQGKPQSIEIRVEHARWDPSALFALPTSRTGLRLLARTTLGPYGESARILNMRRDGWSAPSMEL
jgi:hypothetical protein